MGTIATALGLIVLGMLASLGLFFGGMRAKWPPVVNAVRQLNLRVLNPQQLETAGQPGAFAQVLRHRGRSSGKSYETPVGIEATDDGFVIALVYGDDTQWLRNVLSAGSAEVVVDGRTHRVERPEVVPVTDVMSCFEPNDQRLFRLFGVTHALRLRYAGR